MDEPEDRPAYRVLSIRTMALAALVLVVVGVGVATWLLMAYGDGSPGDSTKLDAIRTAGTIVVGTGGAGALWLVARRQRTSEIALKQKDRDHQLAEYDAAERRVTELYTKAADQLGSDKAPVRLAGMYAMERLAQGNPAHRQTVVNVLCAYLRMPYLPPKSPFQTAVTSTPDTTDPVGPGDTEPDGTDLETSPTTGEENERREQERQVRITAQRILAAHLLRGDDPDHPTGTFWHDIDLDLTGATLIDFNLANCHICNADFDRAWFSGHASFDAARFSGIVGFHETRFSENVAFSEAWFSGPVSFDSARFCGHASFHAARFSAYTWFGWVEFSGITDFRTAWFSGDAKFPEAQFGGASRFDEVRFSGDVGFDEAQFSLGGGFTGARVRLDVDAAVSRTWPSGYAVTDPVSGEDGVLSGQEGRWGHLTPIPSDESIPQDQFG